ncbi:hypothetical protein GV794_03455 [Nocardia cyriacigeorgica]|uniref:Uncharacterized protein n=1 Tax=Nocardia cyriacigeorgica TaxID=135487 RepID=A0ABX0CK64_9NOCA|nr:hypothetical protein [Nocardia cyriacigeorgica]NEW54726.1 hypothetical protein [Nocardia cyriacigeorgica]
MTILAAALIAIGLLVTVAIFIRRPADHRRAHVTVAELQARLADETEPEGEHAADEVESGTDKPEPTTDDTEPDTADTALTTDKPAPIADEAGPTTGSNTAAVRPGPTPLRPTPGAAPTTDSTADLAPQPSTEQDGPTATTARDDDPEST